MTKSKIPEKMKMENGAGTLRIFNEGIENIASPLRQGEEHDFFLSQKGTDSFLQGRHGKMPCLVSLERTDFDIFVCGECTSTFDVAWLLHRQRELKTWSIVLARSQKQGRGQYRRHWHSPPGNLYFTLCLPSTDIFSGTDASVLVGAIMAEVLQEEGIPVFVKWPNDLVMQNRLGEWGKVGGILLEERSGTLLTGVGINLVRAPDASLLRPAAGLPAFCLKFSGLRSRELSLTAKAAALVRSFQICYFSLLQQRLKRHYLNFVEEKLAFKDCPVYLKNETGHEGPFFLTGLERSEKDAGRLWVTARNGSRRLLFSESISPLPYGTGQQNTIGALDERV